MRLLKDKPISLVYIDYMNKNKVQVLPLRLTEEQKKRIKENAKRNNFVSVSEYLRFLGMNTEIIIKQKD